MTIESPKVMIAGGKIKIDFKPELEKRWVRFKFRGKQKGQEVLVDRHERKAVARNFELIEDTPDRKIKPIWYVGRQERAVFWEVFGKEWDNESCVRPGLNIYVCTADWGKIRDGEMGGSFSTRTGTVITEDVLQKIQLLKKPEHGDKLAKVELEIGKLLYDYTVKTNWVEWKVMQFATGRRPSFSVPVPEFMCSDMCLMMPCLQEVAAYHLRENIKSSKGARKTKKFLKYVTLLRTSAGYDTDFHMSRVIKKWYKIWPWFSEVHIALLDWLILRTEKILIEASSSLRQKKGNK